MQLLPGMNPVVFDPADLASVRKAAEKGEPSAQFLMGNAYQKGQGVPQNFMEAAFWYRRGAAQGNNKSQYADRLELVRADTHHLQIRTWFSVRAGIRHG